MDHNEDVGDKNEDESNERQCSDDVKADESPGFPREHVGLCKDSLRFKEKRWFVSSSLARG